MAENRRITRRSSDNHNNAFIIEPNNGRFGRARTFRNRGRGRVLRGTVRDRGEQGRRAVQDRPQNLPENRIHNNDQNHNAAANEPNNGNGNGVDGELVNAQQNDHVEVIPPNPPAIRQEHALMPPPNIVERANEVDVRQEEPVIVPINDRQGNAAAAIIHDEQRDAAVLHERNAPNDVEQINHNMRENDIVLGENPVMLQNHNAGNQVYYPAARGGHRGGGYKHKFYNKYDPYKDNRVHLLEKSVYHLYKTVQETSVKLLENKAGQAPSTAITRSLHSSESTTTERHVCPTASTASLQISTPQMQIASMYPQMYMPPQQMVVPPAYPQMMPPIYPMPPVYQMPPPPIPPLQMQAPGMIAPYSPYTQALTQGWNPFQRYY